MIVTKTTDLSKNQISFEQREQQLQEEEQLLKEQEQREKNSPFSRWTQFNNAHTKELMQLAVKFPTAHAVLYFLIDQMDNYNAVMCSHTVIMEVLGVSRQTVSKAITVLKDRGFIAVYKSGTSNVYTINDNVFWKSWGKNRKYCKFPANIVLAESEQINCKNVKGLKVKQITLKEDK